MGRMAMVGAALGAACALAMAGGAGAQRVGVPGPGAGEPPPGPVVRPPLPSAPVQPIAGRWGGKVGGRWWAGANAPGGWAGYRAPQRGHRLPGYWLAPRFAIGDWRTYGFAPPPPGHHWTRYYDDAVLIDARGEVRDALGGVDWDRYDDGDRDGHADDDRARRDGVTGAAADHAVGGAGRGHRPPPPGAAYREPHRGERMEARPYDGGPGPGHPPPAWISGDGRTTVIVTTGGGPAPVVHAPAPPDGPGGTVITITVQTAPGVTVTPTEIGEDHVTWTRPVARRAVRRPWRRPGQILRRRR